MQSGPVGGFATRDSESHRRSDPECEHANELSPANSHTDAEACIRLLGQEMFRPLREMAKQLGLNSPFETG
jgi:hypothetical protein